MERRLTRARDRLDLLYRLGAEQLMEVQRLERLAHPLLEMEPLADQRLAEELNEFLQPETAPEPETLVQEAEPILDPEEVLALPPVETEPEPEEPKEPAGVQLSRLLGLPPQPTTHRGSPS